MNSMIQCRLRELMAEKSRRDGRRVTYVDIVRGTGVAASTLVRLANDKAARVDLSVISRLCSFFGCQPGDLFVLVPESSPG